MPHSFVSVDAESLALRAPTDRRWRNGQFLALGYPDAYDAVPRLSSTKLARDMFTKADSRVSQSRMMAISTFSAGTSNAAYGGPSWSGAEVRSVKRIGWSRSPVVWTSNRRYEHADARKRSPFQPTNETKSPDPFSSFRSYLRNACWHQFADARLPQLTVLTEQPQTTADH